MPFYSSQPREAGNVLFLILIAVALFAALSFAITHSTRSGGGAATAEQIALDASELMQLTATYRSAITRMKISNGCSDTQISFFSPTYDIFGGYVNPSAPPSMKCHVFAPEGGGVVSAMQLHQRMFMPMNDTELGGTEYGYRKPWFGTRWAVLDTGTNEADMYMVVGDLTQEICLEINKRLGIENPGNIPPNSNLAMHSNVWGVDGTYSIENTFGIPGHSEGCGLGSVNYVYYAVLIPR